MTTPPWACLLLNGTPSMLPHGVVRVIFSQLPVRFPGGSSGVPPATIASCVFKTRRFTSFPGSPAVSGPDFFRAEFADMPGPEVPEVVCVAEPVRIERGVCVS